MKLKKHLKPPPSDEFLTFLRHVLDFFSPLCFAKVLHFLRGRGDHHHGQPGGHHGDKATAYGHGSFEGRSQREEIFCRC